jgi:predicted transcriptional regulator
MPGLIEGVHSALAGLGASAEPEAPARPEPKVSVRSSVKPDAITCLLCGSQQKLLKRHLSTAHSMTPREYRGEFGLRDDYPMVAPAYAERRRELAVKIGLGKKGRGRAPVQAESGSKVGNGRRTRGSSAKK